MIMCKDSHSLNSPLYFLHSTYYSLKLYHSIIHLLSVLPQREYEFLILKFKRVPLTKWVLKEHLLN